MEDMSNFVFSRVICDSIHGQIDGMEAVAKLQKPPRGSSVSREYNRCALSGRSRGVYGKFGLGHSILRKATMNGNVPGLLKASR